MRCFAVKADLDGNGGGWIGGEAELAKQIDHAASALADRGDVDLLLPVVEAPVIGLVIIVHVYL